MRSGFTLFQRTSTSLLALLFTFVIVSNSFPHCAWAQAIPLPPLPSEAQLRDEILMSGKAIELLTQRLLQENERSSPSLFSEPALPGVQEGKYCTQCHQAPPPPPTSPLEIPKILTDPFIFAPQVGTSHWHSHSPEQKFNILHQEMQTLKLKVTQYLHLKEAPLALQVTLIKIYLGALLQYLITSLALHPLSNPLDTLEESWSLTLPLEAIDHIQAYISKPETFQSTKETFTTLIYFQEGRMFFSDAFKISIELSSFLRHQNEDAWFNILKLQTTYYLGRQLLKINSYWPQTHSKNKEFFGKLSQHFRSFNHSFGAMLQDQERHRQTNFNQFLGDHLLSQNIPTLITVERYRDLMSHAPQMWDALGNRFEEYFEKSSWSKIEKEATQTELKKTLYLHPFSLSIYEPRELAQWIKTRILEIKKKFFEDHLEYHFLGPKELSAEEAESFKQTYLADYEKELTPEMILHWLSTFDPSAPAAIKSTIEFLKLSAQIEGTEEQIAEIDEQIQALLLYDFNKHVSWGHTVLPGRKIPQSWQECEMDKEEMNAMVPYPAYPSIPDLMPVEKFPKIKPIEMNSTNFGIVLATLISSVGNNLFLVKHIEKFAKAKTKEELLNTYDSWVAQIKTMFERTETSSHEREKLKEVLTLLEEVGPKIKRLDPKNTETLDDFFDTTKEKIEFLKTKRAIITNILRILDIPIESGTGNPNQRREEKTVLYHIQALKKQDGITREEIETFLAESERHIQKFYADAIKDFSFPIPRLLQSEDYSLRKFSEEYSKKGREFLKDMTQEQRDSAIAQNRQILAQLRKLEDQFQHHFYGGYAHPEYFIGTKGNLLYPQTLEGLKQIQELREKRKKVYLDKGGAHLDEWLKGYVRTLMLRQALITQDLLVRKNIYKVIQAKTINEIKEFVLDPFILNQALELVQKEYPTQEWRVTSFRNIHTRMMSELSEGFLDSWFDSSFHNYFFWGLFALQIILYFIPGAQLGAVAIGVLLLSDTIVQTGHHLFVKTPRSYQLIQNKENFYLSSAIPEDIITAGGAGPGGSAYEDFGNMRDGVFWDALITGGLSVLILPWAKFETKRAIQLFHTKTNWFVSLKIPLYAKNLGIEADMPLTLSLVRGKMAQKLGLSSSEELSNLQAPKLIELTMSRLGKEEGARFLQMVQFFNQKNIAQHLWLTELANYHQALATLGFKEGIPTLEQIQARAQEMLHQNALIQGRPTLSPQSKRYLEIKRTAIEETLRFLEATPTLLEDLARSMPR